MIVRPEICIIKWIVTDGISQVEKQSGKIQGVLMNPIWLPKIIIIAIGTVTHIRGFTQLLIDFNDCKFANFEYRDV